MAAEPEVNPRVEPRIPGYRLEGVVGRGATGVVYRARQLSVDRVVALKVLHPELVGTRTGALRLQREARTTARLAHPNIISAIDMGEVDGVWWYAMELVEGVSLLERLREKPLSEREALRMFIPLCDALQHAFQRGVVHRDIKPANILVDKNGRALLVDLGLAVADDDPFLTKGGGTLGTPHYISPEQARDPAGADVQSDIWSLGATLYHAVCGVPPFSGDSVAEILSSVLYARVPDPAERAPQLSNGFVLVLRKCLTRDRARRYATPAEVSADLERVRERRAPEVKRSALEPLSRRARPVRRALAVGALALVLVGAAWLALRSSDDARLQAQSGAPGADAIERLSQAADGGARGLSRAMSDAEALHGSSHLTVDQAMRVQELRQKIRQRLEDELADFERASEANLARLCADRRFDVAESGARGLRKELAQRVGSEPLPPQLEEDFDRWLSDQAQIVRSARARAEQELTERAARYCKERVVPEVDRLESLGRWRDAQVVLSSDLASPSGASSLAAIDPELAGASAELSAQGLSSDAVERSVSAARTILEPRRKLLEQNWKAVDVEMKAWIDARVAAWREKLEGRQASDAAAELATEWSGELARRNLTVEQMPLGWLRLAQETFVQGTKDLAALEKRLADEDALKSFERLEDDAADLWRQRRYAEAAAVYEEARDDAWRRTVRASMDLRAREAHLLEAFLTRAAQGVRARDGRDVELRAGTISYAGRLRAGPDPLGSGFQLTLSGGKVTKLALRAVSGAESASTALLAADSVEALAALAPDLETRAGAEELAARDQLVRALLRYRDGDAYGARAMLNAGPLPTGEPLVRDLEARIASALGQQKASEGEERARLREKLYWLRREYASKGNREQARRWADELLASTSDALQPEEIADVRRMRDDLAAEAKPSTEQSIAAIFGPSEQSIVGPNKNRVRMTFLFNQATAGAFKPGAWSADGRAWASEYAAKNDAEMLDRAAPTLALVDPLRVQSDDLDVRLTIEEPADSKPDLLLVSVAGFHVALAGAGNGRPARCLIEALEPARVVEHVRAGAGRDFAGLKSGVTHELHIVVNRARGTATVELDGNGRKITESQPQPRDAAPILSVRSFEPVRMLKAVVECARR